MEKAPQSPEAPAPGEKVTASNLPWWQQSLLAGAGVMMVALIFMWAPWFELRVALLIGTSVAVFMLLRNPKRWYRRMFWSLFGAFGLLNLIPGLGIRYGENEAGAAQNFEFTLESPSTLINLGVIALMIVLLVLDYKERGR